MNTAISVFNFKKHEIRVLGNADSPELIAADVAAVLGIQNVRQNLAEFEDDEKGVCTIYTPGGNQEVLTLTEPGFYRLVLQSRKEEAKEFRRWVTHEVLVAIRKTGSYSVPTPLALPSSLEDQFGRLASAVQKTPKPLDLVRMDGWQTAREMLKDGQHEDLLEDGVFRVWLSRHLADTYRTQYGEQPPIVARANSSNSYCYPPEYRKLVRTYVHQWNAVAA